MARKRRVRWGPLIISFIFIIIAFLIIFFILGSMIRPRPQIPEELKVGVNQTYEISQLVQEYSISSTPQIVINCAWKRVGTFASAERRGDVPQGTEVQDLINKICEATGKRSFCDEKRSTEASSTLISTGKAPCHGVGGKVLLMVFHSPTCGMSKTQRSSLDELTSRYSNDVEMKYICSPLNRVDESLCAQGVRKGTYDE